MAEQRYEIGQRLVIWVTGMLGDHEAEVIELSEYGGMPTVKILEAKWDGWRLKDGDYIDVTETRKAQRIGVR